MSAICTKHTCIPTDHTAELLTIMHCIGLEGGIMSVNKFWKCSIIYHKIFIALVLLEKITCLFFYTPEWHHQRILMGCKSRFVKRKWGDWATLPIPNYNQCTPLQRIPQSLLAVSCRIYKLLMSMLTTSYL